MYEKVERIIRLAGGRAEYEALRKGFPQDYQFEQE